MNQKFQNVVIGTPLVHPKELFAYNTQDWEENESKITLFTNETFLPKILLECGVVPSVSEVRRNKPNLVVNLNEVDFLEIKWGKQKVFVAVGEREV